MRPARRTIAARSADDLVAIAHFLSRRLEAAAVRIRRGIGAASLAKRAAIAKELEQLVEQTERLTSRAE